MLDKTISQIAATVETLLRKHESDLEAALNLLDDDGALTISLSTKLCPQGSQANIARISIGFATERIKDSLEITVDEDQQELPLKEGEKEGGK